jgi:hypothetical protein
MKRGNAAIHGDALMPRKDQGNRILQVRRTCSQKEAQFTRWIWAAHVISGEQSASHLKGVDSRINITQNH